MGNCNINIREFVERLKRGVKGTVGLFVGQAWTDTAVLKARVTIFFFFCKELNEGSFDGICKYEITKFW